MIRAVVADDDKETVKLFSELLQSHGIKVIGKGFNGQDAVFLFQKLKPDVIFLDVSMPVFNGVYALEKIRELNQDAVVIMLANNITMNNEIAMNRLKPSAVIHEPIDINEIIIKTNELCAQTSTSRAFNCCRYSSRSFVAAWLSDNCRRMASCLRSASWSKASSLRRSLVLLRRTSRA